MRLLLQWKVMLNVPSTRSLAAKPFVLRQLYRETCSTGQTRGVWNLEPSRGGGSFPPFQRLEIIRLAFTLLRWSGVRGNPHGKGASQSRNWKNVSLRVSVWNAQIQVNRKFLYLKMIAVFHINLKTVQAMTEIPYERKTCSRSVTF
jgi:hypothetical protein